MKLHGTESVVLGSAVAPHAGAWIEISLVSRADADSRVAPHAGAWIEIPESEDVPRK